MAEEKKEKKEKAPRNLGRQYLRKMKRICKSSGLKSAQAYLDKNQTTVKDFPISEALRILSKATVRSNAMKERKANRYNSPRLIKKRQASRSQALLDKYRSLNNKLNETLLMVQMAQAINASQPENPTDVPDIVPIQEAIKKVRKRLLGYRIDVMDKKEKEVA